MLSLRTDYTLQSIHPVRHMSRGARRFTSIGQSQNVVFSEGELYLDDCDLSGSTSPVLVYTGPNSTAVIRNTALGNNNCELQHLQTIRS